MAKGRKRLSGSTCEKIFEVIGDVYIPKLSVEEEKEECGRCITEDSGGQWFTKTIITHWWTRTCHVSSSGTVVEKTPSFSVSNSREEWKLTGWI